MAETGSESPDVVLEPEVPDQVDETLPEPTPIPLEYQMIAYSSLLLMALLPIWVGSKRALVNRKKRLQV